MKIIKYNKEDQIENLLRSVLITVHYQYIINTIVLIIHIFKELLIYKPVDILGLINSFGDFLAGNFLAHAVTFRDFMAGNFMAGDFLAGDFLAHHVTFWDFMAGNFLAGDFLGGYL